MGMKFADSLAIVAPIAVGALEYNAAFLQQPFEHQLDAKVVAAHVSHTEGEILEIYEDGNEWFV
jgi:hypothetical protein